MRQTMLKDRNLAENNTKLNNAKSIGSRNFKNNARGITLIALVITIIVLLILAGVSISAITGNDSAMEKAQLAKENSEKGDELDTIKLAVVNAMAIGENGIISLENLKTELHKIPDVIEGTEVEKMRGKSPWTVLAKSGRKYDITQNGQVADATPKPAGLYNDDGYTSWEKLVEDGVITVYPETHGLYVSNKDAIEGDLIIPEGVIVICQSAFKGCSSLSSITIPSSVTTIEQEAFYNCSSLSDITIPEGVTSIGVGAFYKCSSLSTATIPSSVTEIGMSAFYNCSSLSDITIPEGVTYIGNSTFYNCSSLSNITILEGVTRIGNGAFEGCSSLSSITIPNSVTEIGNFAFRYCSSLESIIIPSGVTSIEGATFNSCSSLSSITIPSSVTSIGNNVFNGCNNLTTVNYTGTEAQWNQITIGSSNAPLNNATKVFEYTSGN